MLKFVQSFKKNSTSSLAQNQKKQQVVKKCSGQLKTLSENEIEINLKQNCHDPKIKFAKILSKRFRLLVISLILILVAVGVLIALVVCLVQFTREPELTDNRSTEPAGLYSNQSVKCDLHFNCGRGYFSIIIDNQCFCRSTRTGNFQHGMIQCYKMRPYVFRCECCAGYQWSASDAMCIDVDECQLKSLCSDGISDGCINKMGSYECGCKSGFRWSGLFHRCVDINECMVRGNELCTSKNSECVNTVGGYRCRCKAGYSMVSNGTDLKCTDYDECRKRNDTCANSTCHNLDGSYECCINFGNNVQCINCGFQYFKPLLNVTGNKAAARIIGGIESNPYSWPWVVSIGINYSVRWLNISHICGGTLISKYTVLTAAHCIYNLEARIHQQKTKLSHLKEEYLTDLAKIITVYAGIHDQNLDKKNLNFTFQVRKIHIHANFDNKMLLNDIAVLILDKSVRKSNRVNWACVGNETQFRFPPINTTVYAAGFGSTNQTNMVISNLLRQVDLKLLKFSDCALVTQTMFSNPKSQFCAGYLNGLKDTCTGDSGSPILYKHNSRWFVIGIVSYGLGCAQTFKPGINTNVSYYLNWINQKIKL